MVLKLLLLAGPSMKYTIQVSGPTFAFSFPNAWLTASLNLACTPHYFFPLLCPPASSLSVCAFTVILARRPSRQGTLLARRPMRQPTLKQLFLPGEPLLL